MSGVDGQIPSSLRTATFALELVSTVSVIVNGASLNEVKKAEDVLETSSVEIRGRSLSPSTWSWVVAREDESRAVRALHALWCEED